MEQQEQINKLICLILAIANFAKDIHYTCKSISIHKFMDEIEDNLYDFIDLIKETYFLSDNALPLPSGEYLSRTTSFIPIIRNLDKENLTELKNLIELTILQLEEITKVSRGENALIDNIAQDLQQKLGLVNLELRE